MNEGTSLIRQIWQRMNEIYLEGTAAVRYNDDDQLVCYYCGEPLPDGWQQQWEHVIPRSRGGGNRGTNGVIACYPCNQSKHARFPIDWVATANKANLTDDLAVDFLARVLLSSFFAYSHSLIGQIVNVRAREFQSHGQWDTEFALSVGGVSEITRICSKCGYSIMLGNNEGNIFVVRARCAACENFELLEAIPV